MTGRRQTRRCALGRGAAAFLLPAGMFLAVCAGLRVAPFGSATLLLYDMRSQYVSFYGALKHALTSGQGIYYALGMQLGSSTAGLAAYYLLSPLNLIFLLFPIQSLDVAVTLVTGLKIGLCGLAFCLCARDRGCETPETPLLSLSYALCGYVAVFFHNLIWLDGILLAPAIYAGIRRILEGRGMTLYVVSLAAAIISCYYIGYMLCIFSVLVFVSALPFIMGKRKSFAHFAAASLLAGSLSAFVWVPALFSLRGGKAAFQWPAIGLRLAPLEALLQLRTDAFSLAGITYGPPNLFCGMLTVLLFPLFVIHRKRDRRERVHVLLLFLSLLLFLCENFLCTLMHGLNEPTWFPYRFSFLISFVLVLGAQEEIKAAKDLECRTIGIVAGVIIAAYGSCALLMPDVSLKGFLWDACLLLLCAVGLSLRGMRRVRVGILALAVVLSVGGNTVKTLQKLLPTGATVAFCDEQAETERTVRAVTEMDPELYRMENARALNVNDPLLHGYAGITHYSSMLRYDVRFYLRTLGYRDNGIFAQYAQGASLAADALLGIRYVLSEGPLYEGQQKTSVGDVWRNPYALPLAFACEAPDALASSDSEPFRRLNEIYGAFASGGKTVFTRHDGVVETHLDGALELEEGVYAAAYGAAYSDVIFTLTAQEEAPLYLYVPLDGYDCEIGLVVNGVTKDAYQSEGCFSTRYLGTFTAGERVEIRLRLMGGRVKMRPAQLYYEETKALARVSEELAAGGVEWERFTQDGGVGCFTAKRDGVLLFTLPFDSGFSLYIDGKPATARKILGMFLGVNVSEGEHSIRFSYRPQGLWLGLCLSALGAAVCALTFLAGRFKQRDRI